MEVLGKNKLYFIYIIIDRALESNRGNLSKFCITRIDWKWDSKNFIRAHTCFNRLDMPDFPNLSSLQQAVDYIIQNEILGFGVD